MDEQLELEAQIQREMAGSERLPGGRDGVRGEAPARAFVRASVRASLVASTSSSASRPGLNRIPRRLGPPAPRNARVLHARVGRLAQRGQHRHASTRSSLVVALVIFVAVERRAGVRARQVPRAQGRGGRADPRQHAPGGRLDGRRRGDPASALAVLTFAKLGSIQDPPNSGADGASARRRKRRCCTRAPTASCRRTANR